MEDISPIGVFVLQKMVRYILSLSVVVLLVFLLPRVLPGDPVKNLIGEDMFLSDAKASELRAELGLDLPMHEQFSRYCSGLFQLDLGYSYHLHGEVFTLIADRIFWTFLFVGVAILIGALIGIPLGAKTAWWPKSPLSRIISAMALVVSSVPPYLLGLFALALFVYHLGLFPFKGLYDTFTIQSIVWHLALPTMVLSLFYASRNVLIMRGSVISEKSLLYPQFARSLGIPDRQVLTRHVRKNALLPVITLIALDFGFLFSGALFIEIIFSLHGMGSLIYDAILLRDYPVLTGSFLVISVLVIVANAVADGLCAIIDPRIRSRR